jgi:adenine-specific DNA-methyltransferase
VATQVLKKQLGAYYTSSGVAEVLTNWAIRSPRDRVIDPSCGEGVFLIAAADRLRALGGRPAQQVYGVDINTQRLRHSLWPSVRGANIPKQNVLEQDFFDVVPSALGEFEAVVGNPPFIRYQTFKGPVREKALAIAHKLGVKISELASSWAPFLVHATQFLSTGGRLAMVVPAEITHATYARPVVDYLVKKFNRIRLASFKERLFPEINQDTLLLFAEGFGTAGGEVRLHRFARLEDVPLALTSLRSFGPKLNAGHLLKSNGRLRNHMLPREVDALYRFLAAATSATTLGQIASVGIGYVTGKNAFFHLSQDEVLQYRIPEAFLQASLLRSGVIQGLRVSRSDWNGLRKAGEKVYLLNLPKIPASKLPKSVQDYLREGEHQRVHTNYKCSVREPWYWVPHGRPAAAFLTYMSGEAPRIAWNSARCLATNSLHELRMNAKSRVEPWKLSIAFCCSLSQLSSEVEGHPLGGGMLKLEPTEAERTLIIRPELVRAGLSEFESLDALVRSGFIAAAMDLADEIVLRGTLALTWEQIQVLREGLREIRKSRRKTVAVEKSH